MEVHLVTTADGFIIEMHRIPFGKSGRFVSENRPNEKKNKKRKYLKRTSRPVVFLQHGLLCSSSDWVLNPSDKALAYMLADRGYGNC